MSRPGRGPAVRAGVLGATVVGIVALGTLAAAGSEPAPPPVTVTEPVASTRVVCPDPVGTPAINSTVTGFVAPGLPGQDAPDGVAALVARRRGAKTAAAATIKEVAGSTSLTTTGSSLPPVVATATGRLAPGFVVDQYTYSDAGSTRGLASLACTTPTAEQWFVGGGAGIGRTSVVVLANPENDAAQVDVVLYGPKGEVIAPGGRGIVVAAGSQQQLRLDRLAPGVPAFAVHVIVRAGRVAAALSDREVDGLIPLSVDWVPVAAPPARSVVVPGVPAAVSHVVLSVVSPGVDATVGVRLVTSDGGFVPSGAGSLDVPAGQLVQLDLTKALAGAAAAVQLTSSAPVVAGVRYSAGTSPRGKDGGYAAGAPALTGPAALAGLPVGPGADNRLLLTSGASPAEVTVTLLPAGGGRAVSQVVKVPADTTVVDRLRSPGGRHGFNVVVTPSPGSQVYAARLSVRQSAVFVGVTGFPLVSVRATVEVPATSPDLSAALPRP